MSLRAGTILPVNPVARVELSILPDPLTLSSELAADVAAAWGRTRAANPALWNGPAFLFHDVTLTGAGFIAEGRQTDFATFLHFRDAGLLGTTHWHTFPVGAVITTDRRLMIGEMGPKTANPGRLYPPSGSFDRHDLADGRLDPLANILREIREEAGLMLPTPEVPPDWLIIPAGPGRFGIVTIIEAGRTSAELTAVTHRHMEQDDEEELSDILFLPFDTVLPEGRTVGYVNPLFAHLNARS